jgi:hypothetical protein
MSKAEFPPLAAPWLLSDLGKQFACPIQVIRVHQFEDILSKELIR